MLAETDNWQGPFVYGHIPDEDLLQTAAAIPLIVFAMPTNPANHAAIVAGALLRLDFDVVEKHDRCVAEVWRAQRIPTPGHDRERREAPAVPRKNARSIRCSHVLEINVLTCQQVENRGEFQ